MKISILGSTGSIGTQALDVVSKLGFTVTALTARHNIKLLEEQVRTYRPSLVAVQDKYAAATLRKRIAGLPCKVLEGMDGLCEAAGASGADIVLNAIVGIAGLRPAMAAIESGVSRLALANKETLVAGGFLVTEAAKRQGTEIFPVDSEHSAIFQCLCGNANNPAKRIILTASGGPFFGRTKEELRTVTPADALRHPNWEMGAKISIDSATLMNKGLELIEAVWLFGLPPEQIDIVVHRESIIHSLVEYTDHSMLAQLGVPDMRIPIQYALTYPARTESSTQPLDLVKCRQLTFFEPDEKNFACLPLCREAIQKGGLYPAAVNGANEQAVQFFLEGKIGFMEIPQLVKAAMDHQAPVETYNLEDVFNTDRAARAVVIALVNKTK